jgi:hypothetical protein
LAGKFWRGLSIHAQSKVFSVNFNSNAFVKKQQYALALRHFYSAKAVDLKE